MKQAMESNSNIAWFKLSELIKRGERERALSVLRLLSHSITDKAFVALLEAELFYLLRDERAKEACARAIALYEQENRYDKIFLTYSTMLQWWPDDADLARSCETQCYEVADETTWRTGVRLVVAYYAKKREWEDLQRLVGSFCDNRSRYIWLAKMCVNYIALYCCPHEIPSFAFEYCKDVAQFYVFEASASDEPKGLASFLSYLASSSQVLYECLRQEIEQ